MKKLIGTSLLTASLLAAGATAAIAETKPKLGPYGYGSVKLGMTAKQAKAIGGIAKKKGQKIGYCSTWELKKLPAPKGEANVYVSPKRGVALIFAEKGVKTPEGVKLGATYRQVKAAYPDLKPAVRGLAHFYVAENRHNKKAHYYFAFNEVTGKLAELALVLDKQDCGFYKI